MGTNVSTQTYDLLQQTLTDITTNIIQQNLTYTTSNVSLSQIANNVVGWNKVEGDLIVGQDAVVENRVYQPVTIDRRNEIVNEIMNQVKNILSSQVEQSNEGLNLGQTNVNTLLTNIQNTNYTNYATTVATTTESVVNSAINVYQQSQRPVIGNTVGGDLKVVQSIDVKNVVENIVDSKEVVEATNQVVNQLLSDIETTTDMSNKFDIGAILAAIFIPLIVFAVIGVTIFLAVTGRLGNPFKNKQVPVATEVKSGFGWRGRHNRRHRRRGYRYH